MELATKLLLAPGGWLDTAHIVVSDCSRLGWGGSRWCLFLGGAGSVWRPGLARGTVGVELAVTGWQLAGLGCFLR